MQHRRGQAVYLMTDPSSPKITSQETTNKWLIHARRILRPHLGPARDTISRKTGCSHHAEATALRREPLERLGWHGVSPLSEYTDRRI